MARWSISVVSLRAALALALGPLSGCGGQSESSSDSGSHGGSGGTITTGGTSGAAGTSGTAGTVTTGGTAGTDGGTGGTVVTGGTDTGGTGGMAARRPCIYGGRTIDSGTVFTAVDGCNTCTCSSGFIMCTLVGCPPQGDCDELNEAYADAFALAKTCQPEGERQCQALVTSALECGCHTFVNDLAGIQLLGQIGLAWNDRACGGAGVTCGACPPEPISAYCSADGVCIDSFRE